VSGFLSGLVPLETGGFEAPGVQSFDFPPFFESVPGSTSTCCKAFSQ
jgi:hypothetical protein